ncbi:MAG: phasin family protein [Pseudomonadota bacterium]
MQAFPYFENQVDFLTQFTQKSYDILRVLSQLNMRLTQQLIEDSINANRQFLACSDPAQWGAIAMKQAEPVGEHLRNYQQQLMGALSGNQSPR